LFLWGNFSNLGQLVSLYIYYDPLRLTLKDLKTALDQIEHELERTNKTPPLLLGLKVKLYCISYLFTETSMTLTAFPSSKEAKEAA